MARLFLVLIFLAACVAAAAILYTIWTAITQAGHRALGSTGQIEGRIMAPTGIQKAAYIALIVVLFGAASGWLGGL